MPKIQNLLNLPSLFLLWVSRDYRVAVRVYGDDAAIHPHIPILPSSADDGAGGLNLPFAPADHIIRVKGKIPFDPYRSQFRCVQLLKICL